MHNPHTGMQMPVLMPKSTRRTYSRKGVREGDQPMSILKEIE